MRIEIDIRICFDTNPFEIIILQLILWISLTLLVQNSRWTNPNPKRRHQSPYNCIKHSMNPVIRFNFNSESLILYNLFLGMHSTSIFYVWFINNWFLNPNHAYQICNWGSRTSNYKYIWTNIEDSQENSVKHYKKKGNQLQSIMKVQLIV